MSTAAISPSGVASLRAKFEQKDESTTPPSRGRSPAASLGVTDDASRPISTVRTSFFAVELSGQMGDLNTSEELGKVVNGDRAEESTLSGAVEKPKTNGIELTPQKSTAKEESTPKQTTPNTPPRKEDSIPQNKLGLVNGVSSSASPDKPVSTAEDNTHALLPSDLKEEAAVPDGAALDVDTSVLGSILKGSPFEQDEKKGEASSAQETEVAAESKQPLGQYGKGPSTPMTNGKPTEAPAQKVGLGPKNKITSRPSAVGQKSGAQLVSSTTETSGHKPQTSTFPAPTTPKIAPTPSKQPLSRKISPKSATSQGPKKEILKDAKKTTVEKPSRLSVAPKAPAAASKPAPRPGKKPGPPSPPSFTKPRPKSPTRPVRLPGSATAPTAASAAKLDAAPAATAKPRDRVSSNPTSLRQKPARTSLLPGPKPVEKPKDKPKSRLSTASSKISEGSFLDRMMRPTQSSSQKAHEKVEAKSPPKKANGARPKRKSDGSEKAKSETVETKGEQQTESVPSPSVQAPADYSETPSTNGENNGIEEAALVPS
ncbi:MAG: hypothetical protein ALECFALPRED_002632 [Alectoria fallacina]|uniref:Uncharacterized protein n=1 Tax=Alectoria fallacina TaxID=1903189 RepID=A0A8H3EPS8_9LECA|nr:MAG: hypothetical protein ALECFALPRED_002632 [Alectoria fallacina]